MTYYPKYFETPMFVRTIDYITDAIEYFEHMMEKEDCVDNAYYECIIDYLEGIQHGRLKVPNSFLKRINIRMIDRICTDEAIRHKNDIFMGDDIDVLCDHIAGLGCDITHPTILENVVDEPYTCCEYDELCDFEQDIWCTKPMHILEFEIDSQHTKWVILESEVDTL